jgi:GNAT superfamily N-acetyltransferase
MTPVTIREATQSDVADILGAFRDAGIDGGVSFTVEEAREQFAKLREYPSYRVFIAELSSGFAGTYALIILDSLCKRGARLGIVENVAVLPAFQGGGIGRAMMEHAREQCRLAGCYKMALSSNLSRHEAHAFYDALDFERHGYSFVIRP